jgi:hypothetical protein
MNNSVYGKKMENVRNLANVKVTKTYNKYSKLINSSLYQYRTIINENILIHGKYKEIYLNKPIFGGFCILELSKLLMYRFYYGYLKNKNGNKVKLLQTDTDSFIIYVDSEDFYEDMKQDTKELFDTSDFPIDIPKALVKSLPV